MAGNLWMGYRPTHCRPTARTNVSNCSHYKPVPNRADRIRPAPESASARTWSRRGLVSSIRLMVCRPLATIHDDDAIARTSQTATQREERASCSCERCAFLRARLVLLGGGGVLLPHLSLEPDGIGCGIYVVAPTLHSTRTHTQLVAVTARGGCKRHVRIVLTQQTVSHGKKRSLCHGCPWFPKA